MSMHPGKPTDDEQDNRAEAFYDGDGDDTCQRCGGEGGYHDCGEDTCCCSDCGYDDEDTWVECDDCGGTGNQR